MFPLFISRHKQNNQQNYFSSSLCKTGIVEVRVNSLVRVSFCIPEKVHNPYEQNFSISVSQINFTN